MSDQTDVNQLNNAVQITLLIATKLDLNVFQQVMEYDTQAKCIGK